eukprot:6173200-Pleurochrysis_carterae.AAC.1
MLICRSRTSVVFSIAHVMYIRASAALGQARFPSLRRGVVLRRAREAREERERLWSETRSGRLPAVCAASGWCVSQVNRLQFLRYHYLLATIGSTGMLRYLDVSTGANVAEVRARSAPLKGGGSSCHALRSPHMSSRIARCTRDCTVQCGGSACGVIMRDGAVLSHLHGGAAVRAGAAPLAAGNVRIE